MEKKYVCPWVCSGVCWFWVSTNMSQAFPQLLVSFSQWACLGVFLIFILQMSKQRLKVDSSFFCLFIFWVNSTYNVELGLTTLRAKVTCSTHWAKQAPPQRTNNLFTITQLGSRRYWTWGQVFLTPKSFPCYPDFVRNWETLTSGLMGEQAKQPVNVLVGRGDVLSPSTAVRSPKAL